MRSQSQRSRLKLRMHDETDMVESSIPGFDRWNLKHNKSSSNSP